MSTSFIRCLVACSLVVVATGVARPDAAGAQDSPPAPLLTLAQAIDLARAGNRPLSNARLEAEKVRERIEAGRTRRWPVLDVSGLAGELIAPVVFTVPRGVLGTHPLLGPMPAAESEYRVTPRPTATLMATVAQPLSQQYRIGLALQQGRLAEQVAGAQAEGAEQAVVLGVRRAYYGVVHADAALRTGQDALAFYRELARLVHAYAAEQAVLAADVLDVDARLALQEQAVAAQRRARETAQEQVNVVLGRDLSTPFSVEIPPAPLPDDAELERQSRAAAETRPDVTQARLRLQQADLDVRLARAAAIPDVSLALTHVSTYNLDVLPRQVLTAGVHVHWEPFTWGRRGREVAERRITARQAATAVQDAEQQATMDVRARLRRLEDARTLVPVAQQAEEAARERLRVATVRFKEDAALLRDVLQQQDALAAATLRFEQACLQYWVARAEALHAMGDRERR